MNLKYGYTSFNNNIEDVWERSRKYWLSLKNMSIKKEISYATNQFGIMNLSRRRSFKQSEEYYLKFITDPNNQEITRVRVCFEYLGDSLLGTESGMKKTVNDWIMLFNVEPIEFQKKPIKENEIYFIDTIEEAQYRKKGGFFCSYCGFKIKTSLKFCPECGSKLNI